MRNPIEHPLPDDLLPMAERLRAERPSLDGLALDRVKTGARMRVTATRRTAVTHSKGALLKSRLAITMILALGILMSLSGAGLAVTSLGDSGSGGDVQYANDSSSTETLGGDSSDSSDSRDSSDPSDPLDTSDVDPAAQESTGGGDELAFTGFAAIPVLLGGIALLSSGFVLRRRAGRDDE